MDIQVLARVPPQIIQLEFLWSYHKINMEMRQLKSVKIVSEYFNNFSLQEQTIFPRGYKILDDQNLQFNDKNLVLCDNPGFQETRESFYKLFSQIGMYESIKECRSIKSIVLVLPYHKILEDKGNRLLESLQIIEDKFPTIFENQTNSFFILVTKPRDQTQDIQILKERFHQILDELYDFISKQQQQVNEINLPQMRSKTLKYKKLIDMCERGQMNVLSINDELKRHQILNSFINAQQIKKQDYMMIAEHEEWRKFLKQINDSAQTWVKLIIEPYFIELPKKINSAERNLKSQLTKKLSLDNKIIFLDEQIQSNKIKIQQAQVQIRQTQLLFEQAQQIKNNLESKKSQILIDERLQMSIDKESHQFQISFRQLKQQINRLQSSIISEQNKKELLKQRLIFQSKSIEKIAVALQEIQTMIQNYCEGYVEQTIIQKKYTLGQKIPIARQSYAKRERIEYLNKVQILPFQYASQFICGQEQTSSGKIYQISRNYSLSFSSEFDNKNILSKKLAQLGGCKGRIQSRYSTLEGVQMKASGKKLLLSVMYHFKKTKKQQQLPYLKITIFIPKVEYYSDLLQNKEAEYRMLSIQEQYIRKQYAQICDSIVLCDSIIEKLKKQLQQKRCDFQKMKVLHEKWLSQLKNIRDKKINDIDEFVYLKKNHLKNMKKMCCQLSQANQKNQKQINEKKTENQLLNKKIEIIKLNCQKLQLKEKRYAYLIKSQMDKNIPKILKYLVNKAEDVTHRHRCVDENEDNSYSREKIKIFRKFLEIFEYPQKIYQTACRNLIKKNEVQ